MGALLLILVSCGASLAQEGVPPPAGDSPAASDQRPSAPAATVSRSGSFAHAIPINLPRGRGPVPEIALAYDSNAPNGLAGMGWSLGGFPAIVRIHGDRGMKFSSLFGPDTYAYLPGGLGTAPQNDNLLVAQPATNRWLVRNNNASGTLMQFESVSTLGQGPAYWIMRDGKGTRYYFGGDGASQTRFVYDGLDRLLREWVPQQGLVTAGSAQRVMVRYTYDEARANGRGRLTSVIDPSGTTRMDYDARGNLTRREITLDGLAGSYVYELAYDDQDRLARKIFPAPPGRTARSTQELIYSADGTLVDVGHDGRRYAHYAGFNALKQTRSLYLFERWDQSDQLHVRR